MARPKASAEAEDAAVPGTAGVDRLTNVLSLMLVKGLKQSDAIQQLKRAGFAPKEIAALLGTTPNTVSVTILQAKKNPKKAKVKRGED
jgi:transcriptional regulator